MTTLKKIILAAAVFLSALSVSATNVISSIHQGLPFGEGQGLAGAYVGTLDNGTVLIAGGTGTGLQGEAQKTYSQDIYILSKGPAGYSCEKVKDVSLPVGMSNRCSAAIGKSLYCFGGETADGWSPAVLKIEKDGNSVSVKDAGTLPEGFIANAAALFKGAVYVHGIREGRNALYRFNPESCQWSQLAACPERPLEEGSTFTYQHNGREAALYLIGGRGTDADGSFYATNVWEYLPVHDKWEKKAAITDGGEPLELAFPAAIAYGSAHVLCFGGTDGKVRAYHAITDTWTELHDCGTALPAATTAVMMDGRIVLASGEEEPGVMSNDIVEFEMTNDVSFGWINYAVVILYLLGMLGVGFYFSRKNNSSDKFFKGGGHIPWWAAGISIFATALSAITFLSIPAKAYAADWKMFMFNMGIILIVPIVINFYLPYIKKLNVASVYQYLENRFSSLVRYLASAFFCLFMFARVAIILFLPSLALNAVTGLNIYLCIILMGVITIIYCTMGGIEAVVWGDVIQGFLLVGGALLSLVWIIHGIDGGFGKMVTVAVNESKFNVFDFHFDWTQPVFWVALIGGIANQLLTYTSDQSVVQKYLTVKDTKGTRKGLWLNGILSVPITFIFFGIGTALFVFFKQRPELLNVGMTNTDSIFPHYMMCQLPTGLAGLLIAAVFAAAMSTLASNINSSTTVMSEDFYAKIRPNCTDGQKVKFAKRAGVIVGGLGIVMALALATFDIASLWDQFNFFLGLLTSGLGGLFMMGIFTKRIGARAAVTGFFGSIVVLLVCSAQTNVTSSLYGFIGLISCFIIGYISSFIFGYQK